MQETGSDSIFQKYKKISTPTDFLRRVSQGLYKAQLVVSSHPPLEGFPSYVCSLVSEHKACIKTLKENQKQCWFLTFKIRRGCHFLQLNDPFCVFLLQNHIHVAVIFQALLKHVHLE